MDDILKQKYQKEFDKMMNNETDREKILRLMRENEELKRENKRLREILDNE